VNRESRGSGPRASFDTQLSHTRYMWPDTLSAVTTKRTRSAATPWGAAAVIEQVTIPQRSGEKRFASVVQLLEMDSGDRVVRFAYTTNGTARRGPVTMRLRDLERLRAGIEEHPGLAAALLGGGA
jgi:hypothetical protein